MVRHSKSLHRCRNIQGPSPRRKIIYSYANNSLAVLIAVNSVHEWKWIEIIFLGHLITADAQYYYTGNPSQINLDWNASNYSVCNTCYYPDQILLLNIVIKCTWKAAQMFEKHNGRFKVRLPNPRLYALLGDINLYSPTW